MRTVHTQVSIEDGWVGPFHESVVKSPELHLEALHELRLLHDDSTVLLYEYNGDPDVAAALAESHFTAGTVEWQTATVGPNQLMYAHDTEPSGLLQSLLWFLGDWPVVVEWPIRFAGDGDALITLVGSEAEIRSGLDRLPPSIDATVVRKADYAGEADGAIGALTDAERETLQTAVDLGHYRNPRDASYQDIADAMECSTGTVGYHLRNAEAKIMSYHLE